MMIEERLAKMTADKLIKIVLAALGTMDEETQIDFITEHIDAQISLIKIGGGDKESFLNEVNGFCNDCLNGSYYSDDSDIEEYFRTNYYNNYYDDDWDYDEYYKHTEWSSNFTQLFKLAMLYIRSGDISTGYEANARLLACLIEMSADAGFLGTDEPRCHINVDWDELFALQYNALFLYHKDSEQAVRLAFRWWMEFGEACTEGFLSNVKDSILAEHIIFNEMRDMHDWVFQCLCFKLLEQLYQCLCIDFDKTSKAISLIDLNVNFYLFAIEGLCENKQWKEVINTADTALERIPILSSDMYYMNNNHIQKKIHITIKTKLIEAYENLSDFAQAFKTADSMFKESPSFELYKRARELAGKSGSALEYLYSTEVFLRSGSPSLSYMNEKLLLNIYSYEGEADKLLKMVMQKSTDSNYYDKKYAALSLIYRAAGDAHGIGGNLSEYIKTADGQEGIIDMLRKDSDASCQTELLFYGVDLIKEIIAFHIGAAKRSRYVKAAYYMCVMRDIFIFLGKECEFDRYYRNILMENSRRPALRDEMSIVYGK